MREIIPQKTKKVGFRLTDKDFEKLRAYIYKTRFSLQYLMEKSVKDMVAGTYDPRKPV